MPLWRILHLWKIITDTHTVVGSVKLYSSDPITLVCSKRKSGLVVERRSKRTKPQENGSSLSKRSDDVLSEEIVLGLKRRLRLDDTIPAKKIKQVEYGSGE
jgi:hypothetical protein